VGERGLRTAGHRHHHSEQAGPERGGYRQARAPHLPAAPPGGVGEYRPGVHGDEPS